MNDRKMMWVLLLVMSLAVTGCFKKSSEQTNIAGTGFDSGTVESTTSEDLSQLPVASTPNSQTPVESLPIEAAPVTQAASMVVSEGETEARALTAVAGATRDQQIQTALKNAGLYSGKIDGKLGPASKKAIEEFQKQNGLKADGKVGPKTWAALSVHLGGPSAVSVSAQTPVSAEAGN